MGLSGLCFRTSSFRDTIHLLPPQRTPQQNDTVTSYRKEARAKINNLGPGWLRGFSGGGIARSVPWRHTCLHKAYVGRLGGTQG